MATHLGATTISRTEFARNGRFSASIVERAFGSWNAAVDAAGLQPITKFSRIPDEHLESEFHRVRELLDHIPTRSEFAAHSHISAGVYDNRFGRWSSAVAQYMGNPTPRSRTDLRIEPTVYRHQSRRRRRLFGAPLNFRGLQHEPIDEQGTVFLFAMVARDRKSVV